MKRFAAIFFLFTMLSANTQFGEVLKLPKLVQHYIEHEQLEHKVSFIDFLKEHYTNSSQHEEYAHHHHDNLPLKSVNAHLLHVVSIVPKIPAGLEEKDFPSNELRLPVYRPQNYHNKYLRQIWQPPRLS